MSDDAYFDDEFVLDDTLIAVLDAEEEKYLGTQAQVPKPTYVRNTPPPPKKQKTHHEWKAAPLQATRSVDEYSDLPEISIQGDGSYGVAISGTASGSSSGGVRTHQAATSSRAPSKPVSAGSSNRRPQQQIRRLSGNSAVPQKPHASPPPPPVVHRPPPQQQVSQGFNKQQAHPVPSQGRVEQRTDLSDLQARVENPPQPLRRTSGGAGSFTAKPQPPNSHAGTNRSSGAPSVHPSSQRFPTSQSRPPLSSQERAEQSIRTELNILRAQFEEINRKETATQQELQQARDARLAKEGEVSILRNNIEKIKQDHAAEVARIQAGKEAAEAMQAQLKQAMREEIDRIKTQYTFRQHEVETSTRKTPATQRVKKISRQIPASPIQSSQMKEWSAAGSSSQAPAAVAETPRKAHFGTSGSPEAQRIRKPGALEKFGRLPGFQSGFESTTIRTKDKGKQRQTNKVADDNVFIPPANPLSSPPSSPTRAPGRSQSIFKMEDVYMDDPGPASTVDFGKPASEDNQIDWKSDPDVEMGNNLKTKEDPVVETTNEVEPQNWPDELQHIIFTHHPRSAPSKLTFQTVMNASIPASAVEQSLLFSSASHHLLEALGTMSTFIDWNAHLRVVSSALVSMAQALNISGSIYPLIALLDLIRTLAYSIPALTTSLLSTPDPEEAPPPILTTACDVIVRHLDTTTRQIDPEDAKTLASQVLALLETLCWSVPEALASRLSVIPRNHRALMILISPSQPPKTLAHATRTLAFLASQFTLFRHFLSLPQPDKGGEQPPDYHRLPQIEQLAFYLVDASREGVEAQQLRENILVFVATLAISDPDALTILCQSYSLIPSIILFLTNISSPFWEEDLDLMASPQRTTSLIRLMTQTTCLLYYMICSHTPKYNLSDKLHHITQRQFSGLPHMFAVTFGRFSFADTPDWVDDVGRAHLEQVADMARVLLELVVDGPELEMIWVSFQPDPEGTKKVPIKIVDDEDEEAFLTHSNEDK